ncbi:MAG: hypothetical protein PHO89_07745 [Methylacidiphilaceae bacterium]|nr:hypothetical protein [Candidatus Methylacidiphilaceae bacterium]
MIPPNDDSSAHLESDGLRLLLVVINPVWENPYRPERDPPITHVMIFLERTTRGRWLMVGSEPNRSLYNRQGRAARMCASSTPLARWEDTIGASPMCWLGSLLMVASWERAGRPD